MSSHLTLPGLTSTSNNYPEFKSKLKQLLLSKGLWHICEPSTTVLTRPTIKIEKGADQAPGYKAPTDEEHQALLNNAQALQNHEVIAIIANALCFTLHHLLDPIPAPPVLKLGQVVYDKLENHFATANQWTKAEVQYTWENIALQANPKETHQLLSNTFHAAVSAGLEITTYQAAVKYARLIQPLNQAYIPVLQDVMRNHDSTLDTVWQTVTQIGSLLQLTAPNMHHAHSVQTSRPRQERPTRQAEPSRTGRRPHCDWCGAPGHLEHQCYSKDPANLVLFPPRAGWRDGATRDQIPEHMREKYSHPQPRNMNQNRVHALNATMNSSRQIENASTSDNQAMVSYEKDPRWVFDSGASMHIAYDLKSFTTLRLNHKTPLPTVTFGDCAQKQATGIGTVTFLLHLSLIHI